MNRAIGAGLLQGFVSDSRIIMRVARIAVPSLFVSALAACGDSNASGPDELGAPPPAGFVVSNAIAGSTSTSSTAGLAPVSTPANVAYMSAAPGTFTNAKGLEIRNKTKGAAAVVVQLTDGGFDPIAVEADAGDDLSITVNYADGRSTLLVTKVATRRSPEVVRTTPSKGRTDVAPNVQSEVVFSEPINRSTVTPSSLIVMQGSSAVSGAVTISNDGLTAQFTPDSLLHSLTDYSFVANEAIRDLDGDALVSVPPVSFTIIRSTVGNVVISVSTTAADPAMIDPDGYTLRVDSDKETAVAINGTLSIEKMLAGPHDFSLGGLAANCRVAADGYTIRLLLSGGETRALSFSVTCEQRVALDGVLAFVSDREGNPEIYKMNADGSGLIRLTNDSGNDIDPAWSPDGKRIAFVSDRDGSPNIYVMNADGTNVVRRTNTGLNDSPAWSPDGQKIAFSSLRGGWFSIYIMDVDGDWASPPTIGPNTGWNAYPAWSPDGERIVFTSDIRAYDLVYDLLSMNANGSDVQWFLLGPLFSPNERFYYQASWSPDGSKIAMVECQWSFDNCFPQSSIAITNADGSGLKILSASAGFASPTWSPDGQLIAFSTQPCRTCGGSIRYVSVDGTRGGLIVSNAYSPSWTP